MNYRPSEASLRFLFWVTIANYIAQVPYYLYSYYFPYHVLPTLSSVVLLGITLLWFLAGYFGLVNNWKYGYALLVSFLTAEAFFYLHSFVFGAFFFQMQNPSLVIKMVFLAGYISGAAAAYYAYLLIRYRNNRPGYTIYMTRKNTLLLLGSLLVVTVVGYFSFTSFSQKQVAAPNLDPTPQNVTLSGTYGCLPHLNTSGPQTMECAFGLKTDDGIYYAVNFGASSTAAEQFRSGTHVTAEGSLVIKEALNSNQWAKYNMKGIFTITKVMSPAPVQGKININVVCEGALAYMTFPDAKSADAFVDECKEGKHPEVIEQYKKQMGWGDGAAI